MNEIEIDLVLQQLGDRIAELEIRLAITNAKLIQAITELEEHICSSGENEDEADEGDKGSGD